MHFAKKLTTKLSRSSIKNFIVTFIQIEILYSIL